MKKIYILSFLFLLSAYSCFAQSGKLFTVDKELSSSLINQLYQDKNDLIWIATEDGLNRYDGAKFTVYKNDEQDTTSLLNNFIRTIYEDSKGNLYFGFFNGLQVYDDATDSFREIPLLLENGEKFGAHVLTIIERKNGEILVGTSGQGIFSLKFEGSFIQANQIKNPIPSDLINYLYEDQNQNLWISTQDKGLFRLSKENKLKDFTGTNAISCNSISSIIEDKNGRLYVGSFNKGFFSLNKDTDTFIPIPYPPDPNLPVFTLSLGKDSTVYIGTEGKGMLIYNPLTNKISESSFNVTTIDFSKAKVHSILEDQSGNLWAGIFQKGVLLIPNNPNNFNYIGHKSFKNNLIGSNSITALSKDHQGTLWVGTDGDGIYGINPSESQSVHFKYTGNPGSVPATIMSIYEDSKQDLWIGSYLNGLAKFNQKTGKCTYITKLVDKYSNPVQRVYSITEDQNQNLWIGSMGAGLFKLNLNNNKITRYDPIGSEYRDDMNLLHNGWIDCLLLTKKGKLFIGTYDGLGCLDLKTNSFISTFGQNRLLPGHIVYSLFEDEQGTVWIGTSKGLMYLDSNSGQIRAFTTANGLPSNVICAIKGDGNSNLWISTNYGISKFDISKQNFFNFYAGDGLQGNEFSKGAAFKDNKGRIFFGGINGITFFTPEEISVQGKVLDIHITDFYIHDQPVKKGMMSGNKEIINTSVREAKTFSLSHNDNSFSIEFSAMEFINPERITYMYSMENNNWITLRPGTNNVTFNNLAPGEYNFKVRAKDYNSYSDVKEITVVISPAWYLSVWAKLIYVSIFIGLTYLIGQLLYNRYRTRKKMQEHIHAKQINEAKMQFFINIAHEIRTPMTLIISPLKKLMNTNVDKEIQKAYHTMYRNSERILLLINQLMDIRKIDKGQMVLKFQEIEMVGYIKDLCSIFDEQIKAKQVDLHFQHETEKLYAWVDPHNFDKTILNVLANGLKFTPEKGKIDIILKTGENKTAKNELKNYVEIIIADNGIGIEENDLENIFDCFFQTKNSQNNFIQGTGIGLHLTRSIVHLHHGIIVAKNNEDGKGCRFIIRLPLGNSHLQPEEIETTLPVIKEHEQDVQQIPVVTTEEVEEVKIKSKSKHRVLVVDDDDEIRKYICQELASEFHMMECSNGKEALSMVLGNTPDLIISDIMMPEVDGITLCHKIKNNVNVNHVPIILLTAKSGEEDNLEGIGKGADAYIVKPFNIEILNKTVQNIIRTREMLRNNYSGNQLQKDKVKTVSLKSSDEKLMQRIMDVINKNIENPSFNVEMLAAEIGISRVHLHRKTKELTNQSTRDLIRNIRLQQAANLISSKNLNISEVAYAVGFTNLATFSSAFKESFGVPPTSFMEDHLKSPENYS